MLAVPDYPRELLTLTTDLLALVGADYVYLAVNHAYCRAVGKSESEILGRRVPEIVGEEFFRERIQPRTERCLAGETQRLQAWYEVPDLGLRHMDVIYSPYRSPSGEILGFLTNARDSTELVVTEKELQDQLSILEASPVVVFLWENQPGWPVESVSRNVSELFGCSSEDFTQGRVAYESTVHPEDLDRVVQEVTEYSRDPDCKGFIHEPYRILHADGSVRWLDDRTEIRRDREGKITHYQGIVLDITARCEAELDLERNRSLLAELEEMARVGAWEMNAITREVRWTEGTYRIHGLPLGSTPCYQEALDFYPPEARQKLDRALTAALEEGKSYDLELPMKTVQGDQIWTRSLCRPVMEKGKVVFLRGTFQDTSEIHRLQEETLHRQKIEALGRLAGGVAHDFNNQLSYILSTASLLLEDLPADSLLRAPVEGILQASEHSAALTEQILSFSRKQVLQPRTVNLSKILEECAGVIQRLVGEKIEVALDARDGPVFTTIDPTRLKQVLLNLAINSRDAMPEGGRLSLTLGRIDPETEGGSRLRIRVQDTGMGMDEATLARCFDPFFTSKNEGTGLGLATVHGIILQSGGAIEVESHPGAGTCFCIFLDEVEPPLPSNPPPVIAKEVEGGQTILMVEDEEMLREVGRRLLERRGYQVLICATAEEALEVFAQRGEEIDLLLTDVVLPKISGKELADRLTTLRPDLPVLFASGYPEDKLGEDGIIPETVHFLQKPLRKEMLYQKLQEIFGASSQDSPQRRF